MSARSKLILLVLAGGFLTMALEIRYLHREVLQEEWQAILPLIFCPVAALACGLALFNSHAARYSCSAVMALGAVVGLYGVLLHSEGKVEPFQRLFTASIIAKADEGEEEEREHGKAEAEGEDGPPVLAPMSLTGLSIVGLLVALPGRGKDRNSI